MTFRIGLSFLAMLGGFVVPARATQPDAPVEVVVDVPVGIVPGTTVTATAVVTATHALQDAVLDWSVDGATPVVPPVPVPLGTVPAGGSVTVTFDVVLPATGQITIAADVLGTLEGDDHPITLRDDVCILIDDHVEIGRNGCFAILYDRLALALDQASNWADIAALDHALGAGATETNDPRLPPDAAPQALAIGRQITVRGQILWTDGSGGTHPAPSVHVEILDEEPGKLPRRLATVSTDDNGYYVAVVDNDDPGGGGDDVFVRVFAATDGGPRIVPQAGIVYHIDSPNVHRDVPDGSVLYINLSANNRDQSNTAFSIHDALLQSDRFVVALTGRALPSIRAIFPSPLGGSYFSWPGGDVSNASINVGKGDPFDWDVVMHEYGHWMTDRRNYNLKADVGGRHNLEDNLAETSATKGGAPRGKQAGIELAWSEGLATFLSLAMQRELHLEKLEVPHVGDASYTDIGTAIDYSVEDGGGAFPSRGEDNEVAVTRILWDLSDPEMDMRDSVALGVGPLWKTLVPANPHTLSEAWNVLVASLALPNVVAYGKVFADHEVAPDPLLPLPGAPVGPATVFTWDPNGAGPAYRLNRFTWELYSADFARRVFISPELSAPSYTPTAVDRETLRKLSGRWIVRGRNTSAPATGIYVSPDRSLDLGDCLFDLDGDGKADLELPDADHDGLCEFPVGKKVLAGTLRLRPNASIEVSGKTIIEADDIVVENGARLVGDAATLQALTLVTLTGDLASQGTVSISASDDVTLRARVGSIRLGGPTGLAAGDRLQVVAQLGSVTLTPTVPAPAPFTAFGGNRVDVTARGADGGITLAGASIGSRRIALDTHATVSVVGAKQLRLSAGTILTTDRSATGLAGSVSDVTLDATGPVVVTGTTLRSGNNVRVQTYRAGDALCLGGASTLAARRASGQAGTITLSNVGGGVYDDGTTRFDGQVRGIIKPGPGPCP